MTTRWVIDTLSEDLVALAEKAHWTGVLCAWELDNQRLAAASRSHGDRRPADRLDGRRWGTDDGPGAGPRRAPAA